VAVQVTIEITAPHILEQAKHTDLVAVAEQSRKHLEMVLMV
jgi:hypothetical protein